MIAGHKKLTRLSQSNAPGREATAPPRVGGSGYPKEPLTLRSPHPSLGVRLSSPGTPLDKQDSCYFSDSENGHSDASRTVSTASDGFNELVATSCQQATGCQPLQGHVRLAASNSAGARTLASHLQSLQLGGLQGPPNARPIHASATFDASILQGLDGTGLQGLERRSIFSKDDSLHSLDSAQGQGLQSPILQGSGLQGACLRSAGLQKVGLQGGSVQSVGLQGAGLQRPSLQGSGLQSAGLQGGGNLAAAIVDNDDQYRAMLDFAVRLGYSEEKLLYVLQKCGTSYLSTDRLLQELMKLGQDLESPGSPPAELGPEQDMLSDGGAKSVSSNSPRGSASPFGGGGTNGAGGKRPILIDGSNVAFTLGAKNGIRLAVDWFTDRGHTDVLVFLPPQNRAESDRSPIPDKEILDSLAANGQLFYAPSRRIWPRYILKIAAERGAILVSNSEEFWDILKESQEYKKGSEPRLLSYSFVDEEFTLPDEPLGRNGPSLETYLSVVAGPGATSPIPPSSQGGLQGQRVAKSSQRCPYGRKCTYGNKCKFSHPERKGNPQQSVTERLKQHAEQRGAYSFDRRPAERTQSFNPALLRRTQPGWQRASQWTGAEPKQPSHTAALERADVSHDLQQTMSYPDLQDYAASGFPHLTRVQSEDQSILIPAGVYKQSPLASAASFDLSSAQAASFDLSTGHSPDPQSNSPHHGKLSPIPLALLQETHQHTAGGHHHSSLCKQASDPQCAAMRRTSPRNGGGGQIPIVMTSYGGGVGPQNNASTQAWTSRRQKFAAGNLLQSRASQPNFLTVPAPELPPPPPGLGQHPVVTRYPSAPVNQGSGDLANTSPRSNLAGGQQLTSSRMMTHRESISEGNLPDLGRLLVMGQGLADGQPRPPAESGPPPFLGQEDAVWGNLENSIGYIPGTQSEAQGGSQQPNGGLEGAEDSGASHLKPSMDQVLDNMRRLFGDSVVNRVLFENPGVTDPAHLCRLVVEAAPMHNG